ncbi:putative serine carboxypeptidase CPVL-like protein, partial [Dinothrombium tinctorium]
HGPLIVNKDLTVTRRKYSWANEFSMLYIDNPAGTGFSFTQNDAGYANNENDVARDLYEALQQFFKLFSELRANDFYITGESYAGKYVPAIAYKIHTERNANLSLKGIAIGDGLCDPVTMFDYGDFLYQTGHIDELQLHHFRVEQGKAVQYINEGRYLKALDIFHELISDFTKDSGINFVYNFLYTNAPKSFEYYNQYLALPEVRKAIHVGNLTYNDGSEVAKHLRSDFMQSVKPWLAVLMDNYRVLIYSGQLDVIIAAPLTERFLQSVKWKHRKEYLNASKIIWKVDPNDEEVAGYVRKVHDFHQVIVRKAGHILPFDQPRAAYDLITRFVYNRF